MSTWTIYVPSRGRATSLLTPNTLPSRYRRKIVVVVALRELQAYTAANPDLNFLAHPDSLPHIGAVRQWIVEQAPEDYV